MRVNGTALVVIGRNEAKHLKTSLPAVENLFQRKVYVDSGSTDKSIEIAKQNNAEIILLDTATPFTAARARNAGFNTLKDDPEIEYLQFIDGDCQLIPEYLNQAIRWLDEHPDFAMVCGRRREKHPERSIFNRLCDLEWNTPVGETKYCGGDVTVRLKAINQVNGYNAGLIAGEDPEICVRLRQAGWKIYRIDADMTWHDANITRVNQWWKRHQRTGYAYAEGSNLHGKPPERHWVKETRRNWLWGGLFVISVFGGFLFSPWIFILLLAFLLQVFRIALNFPPALKQQPFSIRLLYGLDCSLAKIPEFIGQFRYQISKLTQKKQSLIEYK